MLGKQPTLPREPSGNTAPEEVGEKKTGLIKPKETKPKMKMDSSFQGK